MDLTYCASIVLNRNITVTDREVLGEPFDKIEILQLKAMTYRELYCLMIFCGIRVFNGTPLIVMDEDEMRLAYLAFRCGQLSFQENKKSKLLKRGIKWLNYLKETAIRTTHSL